MAQFAGTALALLVGFFIWTFTLFILSSNPLGKAGSIEYLIFFAPIIGTLAPVGARAIASGSITMAAWLAAVAPLLGIVNFMLTIILGIVTSKLEYWLITILVIFMSTIWLIPLIKMTYTKATEQQKTI